MTDEPSSLVACLKSAAAHFPDHRAFVFLSDGEKEADSITYGEIEARARGIAGLLQKEGLPGDRILVLPSAGLDFIPAFFGCLLAGMVAVPATPPQNRHQVPRLETISQDSQARFALSATGLHEWVLAHPEIPSLRSLRWIRVDQEALADRSSSEITAEPSALAFLQYTSGATASPKGVMVSHANLMSNLALIAEAFKITQDDIGVFWLPVYHDMGLIGGVLSNIYMAGRFPRETRVTGQTYLMPATAFAESPLRWLKALTRTRATITGAPNFAYDFCVDHISAEGQGDLDLSHLKTAFCGAEPVLPETLERFAREFASKGFRREAFQPVYGLAENTLMVTYSPLQRGLVTCSVERPALQKGEVKDVSPDQEGTQIFASSGGPPPCQSLLIVDPSTRAECPPGRTGEIWVAGPSVAGGYWKRQVDTEETFEARLAPSGKGPFLRTGDLGFLSKGELFVIGRLKDLIIIHGRNYYPGDLEQTAESSHPAIQRGGSAAFSVEGPGGERLILVVELERRQRRTDFEEVASAVRGSVSSIYGLSTQAVVVLRPGALPRTSSGKVQHALCRQKYLDQSLDPVGISLVSTSKRTDPERSKRQAEVEADLRHQLAEMLEVPLDQVDLDLPIRQMGLGSLHAVALKYSLENKYGINLPVDIFDSEETLAHWVAKMVS